MGLGSILWILAGTSSAVEPGVPSSKEKMIRVRVLKHQQALSLRGLDLTVKSKGRHLSLRGRSNWNVRCSKGEMRMISSDGKRVETLGVRAFVTTPAGFLQLGGRPYRNQLELLLRKGKCHAVNHLPLEKYLIGLVNSEFDSRWNRESVKAQVIAARTYAYYQVLVARRLKRSFDVESTVADQVYEGSQREDTRASKLTLSTRGQVLVRNENGSIPIKAFYHSTCGGATELPQNVWGNVQRGFRKAIRCRHCKSSPRYRWQTAFTRAELRRLLIRGAKSFPRTSQWPKQWRKIMLEGRLLSVYRGSTNSTGRVARALTHWLWKGKRYSLPLEAARFRLWVDPVRLRSTRFRIVRRGQQIIFNGRGYGHGVGMCQWGAKTMGERGIRHRGILSHYYPAAVLRRLW